MRAPEHGYTISPPFDHDCLGELKRVNTAMIFGQVQNLGGKL